MNKILTYSALLAVVLGLGACQGGLQANLDGRKYLAGLEGPDVPTVSGTVEKSAKAAEAQGDYKQAVLLYKQAVEADPKNQTALLGLADNLRRTNQADAAIELYDKLLADNKQNLSAKEGKGLALVSKTDFDAAGKILTEVKDADPKRWKTLNGIGLVFASRHMYDEALQYFSEAAKFNPKSAAVQNNIGLTRALNRDYDNALAAFNAALPLAAGANEKRQIDLNSALVYAVKGDLESAERVTAQYYSGPTLNNNMGFYASLAKDEKLAKTYLNMALTESKTYYDRAWQNLNALSGQGDKSRKTSKLPSLSQSPSAQPDNPTPSSSLPSLQSTASTTGPVVLMHEETVSTEKPKAPKAAAAAETTKQPPEEKAPVEAKTQPGEAAPAADKAAGVSKPDLSKAQGSAAPEETLGQISDPESAPEEKAPETSGKSTADEVSSGFEAVGNWFGDLVK